MRTRSTRTPRAATRRRRWRWRRFRRRESRRRRRGCGRRDGVHDRGAQRRLVVRVAAHPRRGAAVALARARGQRGSTRRRRGCCRASSRPRGAAIPGAELVATDRHAGSAVDVGEPVEPTADKHRVHRRRRQPDPRGDCHRTLSVPPAQMHDPAHQRPRGAVTDVVWPRRPVNMPAAPASRYRSAHHFAVGHDTENCSAARATATPRPRSSERAAAGGRRRAALA